jgi:hypothetical protein
LNDYHGISAKVAILGAYGDTLANYIEFGVTNGSLIVNGDGISTYNGPTVQMPIELKIVVGHMKKNSRDLIFYANGDQVYSVSNFDKLPEFFRIFLYGDEDSITRWDSVALFSNLLYEHFDGEPINQRFSPALLEGLTQGHIEYSDS